MQHGTPPFGSSTGPSPPELAPFPSSSTPRPQFTNPHQPLPEAASPISSRPPPVQGFGELGPQSVTTTFHEDDVLAAGEEAERGGTPGNRWPREETVALLKIRSEMDAAFRDASLKGPLWEDVSRKLAELGYIRNAKKCKEKFENVHKYYKRTKEGRAGRQDGKSYRFFSQLEAIQTASGGPSIVPSIGGSGSNTPTSMTSQIPMIPAPVAPTWANIQPTPQAISAPVQTPAVQPPSTLPAATTAGISFSSDTFTSSSFDSDDEDTEEVGASVQGRKRKRDVSGSSSSRKMMTFFEGLMMQVMEKQEAMQQRFLETIEKREQDRMAREEAWKRQEMARLNREHEILAQERAVAASRDAALISFLQKIGGGQPVQMMQPTIIPAAAPSPRPTPIPITPPPRPAAIPITPQSQPPLKENQQQQQQPLQQQHQQTPPQQQIPRHNAEAVAGTNPPSSSCTDLVPVPEQQEIVTTTPRATFELGMSPSRWPKSEVHALIKLRSGLEGRYQEAGPKGPLWEEISSGMQRLGYNRSSKRCKEKWENINKYFKKVKESNKKRPEDAKTCPYFHQLDALYRKKNLGSSSNPGYNIEGNPQAQPQPPPPHQPPVQAPAAPQAPAIQTPAMQIQREPEKKSENENNAANSGNQGGGIQIPSSNGGLPPSFFEAGTGSSAAMNKPEDIMKELMEQQHRRQAAISEYSKIEKTLEDHNMYDDDDEDDEEDDEDDEEDAKMIYKMQFERQNVGGGSNGGGNSSAKPAPAATTTAGSFLGMVQ